MTSTPLPAAVFVPVRAERSRYYVPAALALLYLVWGSTYLAMRIAVESLPAFGMTGVRFAVAGAALLGIVRVRGEAGPTRKDWLLAIPLGALFFVFGNGFVVLAEKTLPSSIAAVVCGTTPLLASAFGALGGERPTAREGVGMLLGMAGVVVLASGAGLTHAAPSALLVVFAPIAWALGALIARRNGATTQAAAGAQLLAGGIWMLGASFVTGEGLPEAVTARSIAAWVYLVVFGSIVGFSAYAYLLRNARPAVALSYAYVNPVVAVILGALLGGERVGWPTALSATLIVSGVMAAKSAKR